MANVSLNATLRQGTGKGGARKLRAAGKAPAVVYGNGTSATQITIDPRTLELSFAREKNPNTLVELKLDDGSSRLTLVREVQRHPVSDAIEHVDFVVVELTTPVQVTVPLVLTGRAAGTRVGGTLNQLIRRIDVRCAAGGIPATIEVDVTPLNIGARLKVSDLTPPAGCTFVYSRDFGVAEVSGKKAEGAEA